MRKHVLVLAGFVVALVASSFLTPVVYAQCQPGQGGVNLTDCFLLNDQGDTVKAVYATPTSLINLLVPRIFVVAGLIFFFLLIYAVFLFITGDVKGKDKVFEVGQTAVIGFLIMFCAFWIVQLIKLITGANILL